MAGNFVLKKSRTFFYVYSPASPARPNSQGHAAAIGIACSTKVTFIVRGVSKNEVIVLANHIKLSTAIIYASYTSTGCHAYTWGDEAWVG